jgi:hypothetical protein
LGSRLAPRLQEAVDRLGTWIPFARAAELLEKLTGARVSEASARRQTQEAGRCVETHLAREVARLEQEAPLPAPGPEQQFLSADGAMVPVVGGEWVEVKSLCVGTVVPGPEPGVPRVEQLSYFSRLAEAETFRRLALAEMHRRSVERAGKVVAVADAAEWVQGFVDLYRPDAVRVLDFPHAAERVGQVAQALLGEGNPLAPVWTAERAHALKHEGPAALLAELAHLAQAHPDLKVVAENHAYLAKREAHLQYPRFQEEGWPIGSGAMESANKVVVEARLKGAGMHWARGNVNPMLCLRNLACNDRWDEECAARLREGSRRHRAARRAVRAERHLQARAPRAAQAPERSDPPPTVPSSAPHPGPAQEAGRRTPTAPTPERVGPARRKPEPNHPWRHSPVGRARFRPRQHAKT